MKFFLKKVNKLNQGFTIIETMISVSLFIVVLMAGMGALLNANLLQQKSQNMRSIMDNLSFIMEDMSRNLRTGYTYHCVKANSDLTTPDVGTAKSGQSCWGIAFEQQDGKPYEYDINKNLINSHDGDQWVYFIDDAGKIFRSTQGPYISGVNIDASKFVQLTPDEVVITNSVAGVQVSGFSVLGAEPPLTPTLISGSNPPEYTYNCSVPNDCQQPFVIIKLVGTISSKGITTPFSLQTSVSQRRMDR